MAVEKNVWAYVASVITPDGVTHRTNIYKLADMEANDYIYDGSDYWIIYWDTSGNYIKTDSAPENCFDSSGSFIYDYYTVSQGDYITVTENEEYREKMILNSDSSTRSGNILTLYLGAEEALSSSTTEGVTTTVYGQYYCFNTPDGSAVKTAKYVETRTEVDYYIITFVYGLTGEKKQSVLFAPGASVSAPAIDDEAGYSFASWEPQMASTATENTTYTAQYSINTYSVKFYAEDGSTLVRTETVQYGGSATAPALQEKEGYSLGWTSLGGEAAVTDPVTQDSAFRAAYTENNYTITWLAYDGSTVLTTTTEKYGVIPTTPSTPVRSGYDFVRWYPQLSKVTQNITYTAQYDDAVEILYYVINFYDDSGNLLDGSGEQSAGEATVAPAVEDTSEKWFRGWDPELDEYVTRDMDYYAQYGTGVKYTVRYFDYSGSLLHASYHQYGESTSYDGDMSRAGYNFLGWSSDKTNVDFSSTVTASVDYYPIYRQIFTVNFYQYDGTTLIQSYSVQEGSTLSSAPDAPEREGYRFSGYLDGSTAFSTTLVINQDYDFIAQYNEASYYTVRFYSKDSAELLDTQIVLEGTTITAPTAAIVDGYIFTGYKDGDTTFSDSLVITQDYDFVAQYIMVEISDVPPGCVDQTQYVTEFSAGDVIYSADYQMMEYYSSTVTTYNGQVTRANLSDSTKEQISTYVDSALWIVEATSVTGQYYLKNVMSGEYLNHSSTDFYVDYSSSSSNPFDRSCYLAGDGVTSTTLSSPLPVAFAQVSGNYFNIVSKYSSSEDYVLVLDPFFSIFGTAPYSWFLRNTADLSYKNQRFYKLSQYTVTFSSWDGTLLSSSTVYAGSKLAAPAAPDRTDYTFVNYLDGTTEFSTSLVITQDYDFVAQYTATWTSMTITVDDLKYTIYSDTKEATLIANSYSGDITIPSTVNYEYADYTVTALKSSCFYQCTGLTSVTIPATVVAIGMSCFNGCTSLTSVDLSDLTDLWFIHLGCFRNCNNLSSVVLPEGLLYIEDYAFDGCESLESFTIPSTVVTIGVRALYGSTALTTIYCYPTDVPTIESTTFYGMDYSTVTLYVPSVSLSAYKSASYWSSFTNIVGSL